jgi:hypothetical protein
MGFSILEAPHPSENRTFFRRKEIGIGIGTEEWIQPPVEDYTNVYMI